MLIEFRVQNHRSLRDEQALSFEALSGLDPSDTDTPRLLKDQKTRVLPTIALYGANASGKSNVLSALGFMREVVVLSHRYWAPDGGVPRAAFAWGGHNKEPSLYEVDFMDDQGRRFVFGFELTDSAINEEWLTEVTNGTDVLWYHRHASNFRYGPKIEPGASNVEQLTRPNVLFLSTAVQAGSEVLKPIYQFFTRISLWGRSMRQSMSLSLSNHFDMFGPAMFPSLPVPSFVKELDDELISKIRDLFLAADFGIVDVKKQTSESSSKGRTFKETNYFLQHEEGDEDSWLPLFEESDGTRTLFHLAPRLIQLLGFGGVLMVDELESSLHPCLASKIVEMFNCSETNRSNSQLLFSTHDTNLLGNVTGAPVLRRDQVWFTEKDKSGATELYPLTSFKPRNVENLERGYLQGCYGAIPFLGEFAASLFSN